jgi:hypothetical protein
MYNFNQMLLFTCLSVFACTNTEITEEDMTLEDIMVNQPLHILDQMVKDSQAGIPAGQMTGGSVSPAGMPAGAGMSAGSNPVNPNPPVAMGACSDMENLTHIAVPNMESLFNECVASCIFQGDACSVMCLEMKLSLSPECATCFAALGKCGATNCALDCASDSHSPACNTCTQNNCAAAFLSCAGLNLDFQVPQAPNMNNNNNNNMNNMNNMNGGNPPVCIADMSCNAACPAATPDPDCNNGGNPPVCIADMSCNAGCVGDPDCNNGGGGEDPCAIDELYGDGECDICPMPDPDCGGGDPCLIEDLYGDGICDFCPMPDPDCF